MTSNSLWMDIDVMPAAGSLPGDMDCEVAVIGSRHRRDLYRL
jgi:hypothetical protein